MEKNKDRIEIIDGLRGLSVILMVIHHLLYNLAAFLNAPWWLFTNPIFDFLQYIFAGLFIFLSGVSSRFSRSNIKRGLIALALAMGITVVTNIIEMPIWWGVLHLLGFCMLFFGLTRVLWDLIPKNAAPVIFIALIVATALARSYASPTPEQTVPGIIVSILGWRQTGFRSFDYYPILPWLFVFLLGTWAGIHIRDRKLPERFYEQKVPCFPVVGRKALLIYILHQPILYGIIMGIRHLFF